MTTSEKMRDVLIDISQLLGRNDLPVNITVEANPEEIRRINNKLIEEAKSEGFLLISNEDVNQYKPKFFDFFVHGMGHITFKEKE